MSLRSQLPPLDSLVSFEAAARLLSFTGAARELNLSQAAVSQQIRNLETRLGVKLFARMHRSVALTAAGRDYQHTVSPMLRTLSSATSDIQFAETRPRLTIAADQAVASMLLAPRLEQFIARHRDVTLRLIASDHEVECLGGEVQVAFLHGDGYWPGFAASAFFSEDIFPVCSAGYLDDAPDLKRADDLIHHRLLHLADDRWNWVNWRGWLAGNGVDLPAVPRAFEVNSYPLLIEAARHGQGLALGWGTLVDDDLRTGRLVRPLTARLTTGHDYFVLWREDRPISNEMIAFCRWICESYGISLPTMTEKHEPGSV